jgi:hypothetical protein
MNTLLANQAIDLAIASILSMFAVLIGAVAGYIKLRGEAIAQREKLQAVKEQVEQQGSGGSPTTVVAVPPMQGAGKSILTAPVWNQLNDVLPDGQQDPYATTDCGEESVAMAIAACGGPSLPAGVLRQLLGGVDRPGMTTARDLSYLLSLFKVSNHPRQADPDAAWTEWQHSYQAKYLVIALGYWVSPGFRHWCLIRETDSAALVLNDPWGGQVRTLSRDQAQRLYCGEYVHIDQAVTAPAAGPPS